MGQKFCHEKFLLEIENSKIEFNMQAGSDGQSFLDIWLRHTEEEKATGKCKDCSYWGWYGKQRNFYPGQVVFSFARMPEDEWLLIVNKPAGIAVHPSILHYEDSLSNGIRFYFDSIRSKEKN